MVIVLSGCFQQGGSSPTELEIYKGTEGIVLEFMPNLPPNQIYTNNCDKDLCSSDKQELYLRFSNKGAHTGSDIISNYFLSGFNEKLLEGTDTKGKHLPALNGKSSSYPQGEIKVEKVSDLTFKIPKDTDAYDLNLMAMWCYNYKTYATAEVCIDPDPVHNDDDVCSSGSVSLSNQGAPVAVSNVLVDARKNKAIITIDIKNAGKGTVLKTKAICIDTPLNSRDIVTATIKLGSGTDELNCPEARLYNGKAQLRCEATTSGTTAYKSILKIELNYKYKDSITKDISVKKS